MTSLLLELPCMPYCVCNVYKRLTIYSIILQLIIIIVYRINVKNALMPSDKHWIKPLLYTIFRHM